MKARTARRIAQFPEVCGGQPRSLVIRSSPLETAVVRWHMPQVCPKGRSYAQHPTLGDIWMARVPGVAGDEIARPALLRVTVPLHACDAKELNRTSR